MISFTGHVLHLLSSENLCELVYTHISKPRKLFFLVKYFERSLKKALTMKKTINNGEFKLFTGTNNEIHQRSIFHCFLHLDNDKKEPT